MDMKRILYLFLLLPLAMGAQGIYATHSSARPVREMVVRLSVPSGQDMNQQETVQFDSTGRAVSVTKRGFGGEVTYTFGPEQNVRAVVDQDGDTLEVHRPGYSAFYAYRRPHQRSAAKVYYYKDGVVSYYRLQLYNKKGDVVMSRRYTPDDLLEETAKYRYRYDTEGNWVARDYILDNKTRYTHTREIQYW